MKYQAEQGKQILVNEGGGGSDSGGGFTGQAMKSSLVEAEIADPDAYIHVHCTHHNDQTSLQNGVNWNPAVEDYDETLFEKECPYEEIPNDFLKRMQDPILTQ